MPPALVTSNMGSHRGSLMIVESSGLLPFLGFTGGLEPPATRRHSIPVAVGRRGLLHMPMPDRYSPLTTESDPDLWEAFTDSSEEVNEVTSSRSGSGAARPCGGSVSAGGSPRRDPHVAVDMDAEDGSEAADACRDNPGFVTWGKESMVSLFRAGSRASGLREDAEAWVTVIVEDDEDEKDASVGLLAADRSLDSKSRRHDASLAKSTTRKLPRQVTADGGFERRPPRNKRLDAQGAQSAPPAAGKYKRQRYVTKDGKCRVRLGHIQDKMRFLSDIFTTIVDLKYRWFLAIFTLCYLLTWLLFGLVYLLMALIRGDLKPEEEEEDHHQACFDNVDGFLGALLFSVETQRTIGYGTRSVTSHCPEGATMVMVQSILGSIIDALMVGCMFVKIARPKKRAETLVFTQRCVVSQRDGHICLMFRLGDLRDTHLVGPSIRAKLVRSRQTKEGEFLPLEQSDINLGSETGRDSLFLVEPQLIFHVIDENSPFWECSAESLQREEFEIVVILQGTIEATGMTCQALTSYTNDEILWGHRFEPVMSLVKGAFKVDYSCFENTYEVNMPRCSAKEMYEKQRADLGLI